jgi:hypothetical protein
MSVNVTFNNPRMYECILNKHGTYLIPVGRGSYPTLYKPRAMQGESDDKAKFSLSLILPKAAKPGLVTLDRYIKKLARDKWSEEKAKKIKYPILDNREKSKDAALAEDFPYLIRFTAQQRPMVVFGNLDPCEEDQQQEAYAGRWMRVSARLFTWERPSGYGVSLGLSSVQLLDHDDRFAGGRGDPSSEFEGFATDEGSDHPSGNGKGDDTEGFDLFN